MGKHICFIIPSLGSGGAQRVVSLFSNHLVRNGYKISIILLLKDIVFPLDPEVRIIYPNFEIKRNVSTLFKVIRFYRKNVIQLKPDVILSFQEFYNEITMLALTGLDKKIFLFERNSPYKKRQNKFHSLLRRMYYPRANGIIVQTTESSIKLKDEKLNDSILVLPNPLSNLNIEWNSNFPQSKSIVCVGRLETQKNQKYLIDVFAEIINDDWILKFVGEGTKKMELEKYVKYKGLGSKVEFLGFQSNIPEILAESTVFAFPSLHEGYPNALLEALAVGVPSISNNCPTGPSDLIKNGVNGFLVDIGDKTQFKRDLVRLMTDPHLRSTLSHEAKKIKDEHRIENISEKMISFIFSH